MTPPPERRHAERRSKALRQADAERMDRLAAALDFCRSAIEACRDGATIKREDAEAVLRIVDRAKLGLWPDLGLQNERERAIGELRKIIRAAWQQRSSNISIPEVLDRLIVVARGSS